MAVKEHLSLLLKSVMKWNKWRKDHPNIKPDLSGADLIGANLKEAELSSADLSGASLRGADLTGAHLYWANLMDADLSGAYLYGADLYETNLKEANLMKALVGWTTFANIDLRVVRNLNTVIHRGPSYIDIYTLYRSQGKIPEVFLRRAGTPDSFITHLPSLVRQPIQFYSCFISYSSKDESFAKRLYADLQNEGVRCWFAPEDMKIGDEIRESIDQSIRMHDKLLIILSKNSINSEWVKKEVETAFEEERRDNKKVLFPLRLDSAVMDTNKAWAADIRRTRHIADFTNWKNLDEYQKSLQRLLRDLKDEVA